MPPSAPTHKTIIAALRERCNPAVVVDVAKYFRSDPDGHSSDNRFLGVSIGGVFPLAKANMALPPSEIERLLESVYYEARLAAVSIMDFKARAKGAAQAERKALFELYLRRHDRINNWDLVDRAAPYVVGGYFSDKHRGALYKLAKSASPWERRTAIVATYFFIRADDTEDTFKLARLLVRDPHPLVQKAVGSWVREAGKRDETRLLAFLDDFAGSMPRTTLRYAVEKLPAAQRAKFMQRSG